MIIAGYVFFGLGAVFIVMANIGVLVFPDVYTRLQASSTCSTIWGAPVEETTTSA